MADVQVTDLAETLEIQDVDFLHVKNGSSGIDEKFLWSRMVLPVNKGGTGATTSVGARTNLELGTTATKDVVTSSTDTTAGRVLFVGASQSQLSAEAKAAIDGAKNGYIGVTPPIVINDAEGDEPCSFQSLNAGALNTPPGMSLVTQPVIKMRQSSSRNFTIIGDAPGNTIFFQGKSSGAHQGWQEVYHSGNTTVDSSGFIKEASPIVKLFHDRAEFNSQCSDTSAFEKVDAGHYLIKNTLGFAKKGWYIETPKDANNNVKFYVEYEQLEDNTIEVKTYETDYSTGKCTGSVPMDITADRWIDLRLEPEVAAIADDGQEETV